MNSLFIKNTLVQNVRGKINTFRVLIDSGAEVNIINYIIIKR